MEKLELKHIVGYLPYVLMLKDTKRNIALTTTGAYFNANKDESFKFMLLNGWGIIDSEECKPILRPTSEIEKVIDELIYDVLGTDLENFNESQIRDFLELGIFDFLPYVIIKKLYEWHFDIHDLIEKGLAIDINTLTK